MKGFKKFQELKSLDFHPSMMGINGSTGDVNRVAARVNIARSFQGLLLEGISERTTEGYNGLFRVLLAYSAFEQFLALFGCQFFNIEERYPDREYLKIANALRKVDKQNKFWHFVHGKANGKLKWRLGEWKAGRCNNPAVLATGVRHAFAHGHLSANANEVSPSAVKKISQLLTDFMLDFIDGEFEKVIDTFHAQETEKGLTRRIHRKNKT